MGFGGGYMYKFIFLCAIASIILGMVTLSVQGTAPTTIPVTAAVVVMLQTCSLLGSSSISLSDFIFLCAIASIILGMVTLSVQGGTRPEP